MDYRAWQSDLETALKTIMRLKDYIDKATECHCAEVAAKDAEIKRLRGALEHIATISENIVYVDGDDRMPLQQRIALQALKGTAHE